MFGSLARRLTAWYVFVAVMLVVLLTGSLVVTGLIVYAKDANDQIAAGARQVADIERRATSDHDDWDAAQSLLLRRLAQPGLIVRTRPPPPPLIHPPRGPGEYGYFRYPPVPGPRTVDNAQHPPPDVPLFTNRFGFVAASSLGIQPARKAYMGGLAVIFVDLDRVQRIVSFSIAIVVATGVFAGLVAWAIGRYITNQAMRPLYDVTSALVRFAGRDFTVGPINVAGRSEFDELVRAYNAAADQVVTAFAERAAAEGQMRQFVADAGHELRTPLTIVLGYIDMLKRRAPTDDDRSRRIFETIAIEGTRMRTLIDNLVLLAKLEREDTRPVEPFALTPMLEDDIVATRIAVAPDRRIDLRIDVDATIIGDRSEIYEAIANVVDNALKYAPHSPVRIEVRAESGGVEVRVSDDGPGIDPVDQEAIFDRFYRGSLRGEFEGSGLGLPIAKRAVERAGGTLYLAQTSPAGSTFGIRLRADRVSVRSISANARS